MAFCYFYLSLSLALFFISTASTHHQCGRRFNNDHGCDLYPDAHTRALRAKEHKHRDTTQTPTHNKKNDRAERKSETDKPSRADRKSAPDNSQDVTSLEHATAVPMDDIQGVAFQATGDVSRVSQGMNKVEEYFAEGLLDKSFDKFITRDIESMMGNWRLVPQISESTDAIFQALGVSNLKRTLMRDYESLVEIRKHSASRPALSISTHLPLSIVKDITVYVDGKVFQLSDSDTGTWNAVAVIYNGLLLQKRVSNIGTMYDVRATLTQHPESRDYTPVNVFKWTFYDRRKDRTYVAHRYFKAE